MKIFSLLIFISLLCPAYSRAEPIDKLGWRGIPVHGKYVKEGEGWRLVGEISKLVDTDTNELVGFSYYRDFRSYYILQNHGQPMIEAWDFPTNCSESDCPDSKLARVTFFPYKNEEMLGELTGVLDEQIHAFRIFAGKSELLRIDSETMEISGGVIREDSSQPPKMLVDPAISCNPEITCIRSLAFGRLGHEDLRPQAVSKVFARSSEAITVPNVLIYIKRDDDFANPARYANESALIDAVRQYKIRP